MFKKREKPGATRQASNKDDDDGETGSVPVAQKKSRAATTNSTTGSSDRLLIGASTKRSDSTEATKLELREADAALSGFKASNETIARPADDAVRLLEIETAPDKDQRAIHERNEAIHKGLKDGTLETGVYRGLGGYKRYANRSEGAISKSKVSGLLGPTRNTLSNVRSTMRIEYWNASSGTDGGVCKDYKETGYCGFGDSCKFLHDRSDYKQGYELEREWEAKQKKIEEEKRKRWERRAKKRAELGNDAPEGASSSSSSSDEDDIPKACPSCNERWEQCNSTPVQTVCGHYFCEDCAMTNFARSTLCMTCSAKTNGIFNSCDALEAKIKRGKAQKLAAKTNAATSFSDPFSVSKE
eukprot:TRINITY_DN67860_c0_g1_i1.p1 TRINITY_DN67860_c0_g1~~TRINITY_DN67860_c0_g1_i1.p1  ORF type:complete len:356 (+),score=70.23 TRINITY_DN67860_c0_g1_i1:202-1269(+)